MVISSSRYAEVSWALFPTDTKEKNTSVRSLSHGSWNSRASNGETLIVIERKKLNTIKTQLNPKWLSNQFNLTVCNIDTQNSRFGGCKKFRWDFEQSRTCFFPTFRCHHVTCKSSPCSSKKLKKPASKWQPPMDQSLDFRFLRFFSPLHLHPKFSCSSTKSGAKPIYFRAFGLLGIHTIVPAKGMQRPSAKPNLFFCGTNLTNSDEFRQIPCQCGHGLFGSSSCCDYSWKEIHEDYWWWQHHYIIFGQSWKASKNARWEKISLWIVIRDCRCYRSPVGFVVDWFATYTISIIYIHSQRWCFPPSCFIFPKDRTLESLRARRESVKIIENQTW